MEKVVKPYSDEGSKKEQVATMFNNISSRYDFLNHLLSFNIDKRWRSKARKLLSPYRPKQILDVATGTGDFALELLKLNPEAIHGVDISAGMLEVGREKMKLRKVHDRIHLSLGDAESMAFPDGHFEAVTVAFGVRNFEHLEIGLREIYRTLKTGYPLIVLEFSKPKRFPWKQVYQVYFSMILPVVGRIISKDARAYSYLPQSVQAFPEGDEFQKILMACGYRNIRIHRLTFGIATIYLGEK